MSLDADQVRKIAHLARLAICDEDIPGYAHNLSNILDLVEKMNQVNTAGIEPMAHPQDAVQRLREDQVTETDQREHFQANSPLAEDGLFLVPRVIE
jgi:aspartyl-tRNA(Asn)/glutamyl-tRNA(Gln) amidotransferase subunit C